ncbi:MAG TPA: hypothetical protein PLC12_00335, partial [Candidatus Methanofastidiosa archaeon]|nr:hypothetical protein [Candidatus Methanofastidiosa archaeon]
MGGICGSFGPHENLEELVESIRTEHDRVLYATNPGVALVGKEGTCLGDGFLFGEIYSENDPAEYIKEKIEDTSKSLADLARNADGEFAIVVFENEKLCVARDFFGKMPTYIKRKPTFQFLTANIPSSKSLRRTRMPEGSSILARKGKIAKKYSRPTFKYRKKRIDFFTSIPLIKDNLTSAIERRAESHKRFDIL